jgi:hypothetical protein
MALSESVIENGKHTGATFSISIHGLKRPVSFPQFSGYVLANGLKVFQQA